MNQEHRTFAVKNGAKVIAFGDLDSDNEIDVDLAADYADVISIQLNKQNLIELREHLNYIIEKLRPTPEPKPLTGLRLTLNRLLQKMRFSENDTERASIAYRINDAIASREKTGKVKKILDLTLKAESDPTKAHRLLAEYIKILEL